MAENEWPLDCQSTPASFRVDQWTEYTGIHTGISHYEHALVDLGK